MGIDLLVIGGMRVWWIFNVVFEVMCLKGGSLCDYF